MFYNRSAGTGSSFSGGNQNLNYGTAWREYTVTATFPQLVNDEQTTSSCAFTIANLPNGSDLSIKDIGVYLGPVVPMDHVSTMAETFAHDFASIPAGSAATATFTVIGAIAGESVTVRRPVGLSAAVVLGVAVTAANTVTLTAINPTASAIDLPSLNFVFEFK
jgi:hypothetical protein